MISTVHFLSVPILLWTPYSKSWSLCKVISKSNYKSASFCWSLSQHGCMRRTRSKSTRTNLSRSESQSQSNSMLTALSEGNINSLKQVFCQRVLKSPKRPLNPEHSYWRLDI